ncbi:hypothetical protein D3C76_1627860 [compost metagenome]
MTLRVSSQAVLFSMSRKWPASRITLKWLRPTCLLNCRASSTVVYSSRSPLMNSTGMSILRAPSSARSRSCCSTSLMWKCICAYSWLSRLLTWR